MQTKMEDNVGTAQTRSPSRLVPVHLQNEDNEMWKAKLFLPKLARGVVQKPHFSNDFRPRVSDVQVLETKQ